MFHELTSPPCTASSPGSCEESVLQRGGHRSYSSTNHTHRASQSTLLVTPVSSVSRRVGESASQRVSDSSISIPIHCLHTIGEYLGPHPPTSIFHPPPSILHHCTPPPLCLGDDRDAIAYCNPFLRIQPGTANRAAMVEQPANQVEDCNSPGFRNQGNVLPVRAGHLMTFVGYYGSDR